MAAALPIGIVHGADELAMTVDKGLCFAEPLPPPLESRLNDQVILAYPVVTHSYHP